MSTVYEHRSPPLQEHELGGGPSVSERCVCFYLPNLEGIVGGNEQIAEGKRRSKFVD